MAIGDTITTFLGTLQEASFRGTPFWVKSDVGTFGRRNAHHEIPKGDKAINEDMGKRQRSFSVTAYVVGDDAINLKDACVAAAEAYGSGTLILPAEQPQQYVCDTLKVTRNKDDQGIFDLVWEFYEDPDIFSAVPFSAFESQLGGLLTATVPIVSAFFTDAFASQNVLPYVVRNAVNRVQSFAQTMLSAIDSFGVPESNVVTRATTSVMDLYTSAPDYVKNGTVADVVGNIFEIVNKLPDPSVATESMTDLATFSALENVQAKPLSVVVYSADGSTINFSPAQPRYSPSEQADADNAAAFNNVVRIYALMTLAKAISAHIYPDRLTAIQVRANIADLFQRQMEQVLDFDIAVALSDARSLCVKSLTQQIVSIAPIVEVTNNVSMPSLYWAARLYNDASRAQELSERNLVRTPAYMPQQFDALYR